ncbi:MAG: hypothetical protein SPI06_05390 [Terrisporobacter sp.]|uniref:hypothetical protein n=1 Tax=Terrisporobacter sp. TaxID=1965305 RepID=UPI002A9091E1|nr:hypothetical protein [Terrisporobacter sp.]MDY6152828.1 hypothetical protein [Terrisporobacter sp.]
MSSTEKVLKAKIQAIDNFTKPMQKVISQTKAFQATAKAVKPLVLKAKDMASKVISKVKAQVDKFKATKFGQFVLKAKDMASKVLSKVNGTLRAFAGKVWSATVSVKDKASSVLSSIQGKLSALALGATITVGAKTGFNELANEQTEKLTINRVIKNSGKSKEEAKKSTDEFYKYLEEYANKTPFETSAVTQFGTKAMMMSKGNVDNAKELTSMMGNVKAFVGNLRTETEVAEAFFSASNGNMEMLNNMLGTQYKTFEEAKKGIAKNQGGLVEEMSTTLGGLLSTISGKMKNSLKGVTKVFADMLSGSMSGIIGFIDSISPKMVAMAETVKIGFEAFAKSEQASQYMQIFKTVFEVAWNLVKSTIEAVRPVVESIFNFIAQHSTEISAIVKTFGTVWQSVWKTVGVLLQGAWGICEPILSTLVKALAKVSGAVEQICSWWNKMTSLLSKPINAVVNVAKKGASWVGNKLGLSEGRNAFGSGRIARDGTIRTLHEGEKILTKQEANRYDKGQNTNSISVVINGLTVREESDINKIASQLLKKINENKIVYGGAY